MGFSLGGVSASEEQESGSQRSLVPQRPKPIIHGAMRIKKPQDVGGK